MSLSQRYESILSHIRQASPLAHPPRLIAVSKGHPPEAVSELYALGQRDFGENYESELLSKAHALPHLKELRWVFLGQLQSRKLPKLLSVCEEIQTIGSLKHLHLLAQGVKALDKQSFPYFVQYNVAQEPQKAGCLPHDLPEFLNTAALYEGTLDFQGLMVIPPVSWSEECARRYHREGFPDAFGALAGLVAELPIGNKRLSLGMSQDYPAALRAGAQCVRIGTELFGVRA